MREAGLDGSNDGVHFGNIRYADDTTLLAFDVAGLKRLVRTVRHDCRGRSVSECEENESNGADRLR